MELQRRRRTLLLEELETRRVLADPPQGDIAEGNASQWSTFASDSATASIVDDSALVKKGTQSLKFVTQSGFDTGVKFPKTNDAHWDLTSRNYLKLWAYGENNTPIGWQGNQPIVILRGPSGTFRYAPTFQAMSNHAWGHMYIPLAGGDGWTRTVTGTPTLADVNQLEIHQDTWDFGFSVYYDGIEFLQRDPNDLPPAGPDAPPGVNPDEVNPRVLLYVFDPIMENYGGQRLHNVFGWEDGVDLGQRIAAAFAANSHGIVNVDIVDTVVADVHPYLKDGFQFTDATFATTWINRDPREGEFDYPRFVAENNLCARINSGDIDEVWIYAAPFTNMWESAMGGPGAYWINGPTQATPGCNRAFAMMGLNYEAGFANALHSFGHRSEGHLWNTYGDPTATTNWDRFLQLASQGGGTGGIGNIHFPVNGVSDYDYANASVVQSTIDQWANYPNLTGATRAISRTDWQRPDGDWHLGYMNFWYSHLPHFSGRGPDFLLNNWWRYLFDIDQFKRGTPSLRLTEGQPSVATQSPASGARVAGIVKVAAAASVEGALGRVDLYVDGAYHSSDTIAPFAFDWDTSLLADGVHTLVTKAYELQNGTEGIAAPLQVIVGSANVPPTIGAIDDQVVAEDEATAALPFTIADLDTALAALSVTAISSNLTLVPAGNIELAGTGAQRTIRIQPAAGLAGVTTITLTVSDGIAFATETFNVSVGDVNDPPTITPISNRAIDEDGSASVTFSVGDEETPAAELVVSLATNDPSLPPVNTLFLVGNGADYTLEFQPLSNWFGNVAITVTVSDGVNVTPLTFSIEVRAVNDPPTLAALAAIAIDENTSTGQIAIAIGDVETPAASLTVSVASNNAVLLPQARMTLGGSGPNRTLTLAPALNQHGQATITVSVIDGATTTSRSFLLTVNDVNSAPTVTPITDQQVNEDVFLANVTVTVGDDETPPGSLTVSAASDNLDLFPPASFLWFGSGANRILQSKPAPNAFGTATVTVSVNDGSSTTTTSFDVEVFPVNDGPSQITLSNNSLRGIVPGGVVGIVGAVDPDPGDTHTWSVSDSRFQVLEGRLRLKPGVAIDPALTTSVGLSLTVQDSVTRTATSHFVISVLANPFPWQNPLDAFDIDDDGVVVPLDALLIILELNATGPRTLVIGEASWPAPFIDPSGDNFVSPLDALLVINFLNAREPQEAEPAELPELADDWPAELALWYAWQEETKPLTRNDS